MIDRGLIRSPVVGMTLPLFAFCVAASSHADGVQGSGAALAADSMSYALNRTDSRTPRVGGQAVR